ncbi:MAG: complex I subunit 1/NuoH family protein [Armatimonadota bacterium]
MTELFDSPIWRDFFVNSADNIPWYAEFFRSLLRFVIALAGGLGSVPVLVWLERRLLGFWQGRLGPNRVGPFGLLQPMADALKLMMKEDITPSNVDKSLYYLAPAIALVPVICSLTVLPWNSSSDWGSVAPHLNVGILFLLAVASIEVYGVILAGWSSNNKYSLLGGLRASSQVISYELGMGLSIIAVLLMTGTLAMQELVHSQTIATNVAIPDSNYTVWTQSVTSGFWNWNIFKLFPFGLVAAVVYMISMIAETNRAPFDLPEAETELVAGFHTEYTSFKFAMFFMGEYANMMIVSAICVTLFLGGYTAPWGILGQLPASWTFFPPSVLNFINHVVIAPMWLFIKLYTLISFFILVRASQPRLRYDMLMHFGWKVLLPTALANVVMIATSMALQQIMGMVGHFIAVGTAGVLAGIVLWVAYLHWKARKSGAEASRLPIRRESVVRAIAARMPVED